MFLTWTRAHRGTTATAVIGALAIPCSAPGAALDAHRSGRVRVHGHGGCRGDGNWVLQVVDSTPWSMVVRVLASTADAPSSWDLRCEVREQLIAFLRDKHPHALPRALAIASPPSSDPVGVIRDEQPRRLPGRAEQQDGWSS